MKCLNANSFYIFTFLIPFGWKHTQSLSRFLIPITDSSSGMCLAGVHVMETVKLIVYNEISDK